MNLQQLSIRLAAIEASLAKMFGRKPADAGDGSGETNAEAGETNQAATVETLQASITQIETAMASTQAEIQKRDTRIEQLDKELKDTKATLATTQADLLAAQKTIENPKGEIQKRAAAQAAILAAKQGLPEGIGEEGGNDENSGAQAKTKWEQYQELRKESPLKAQQFWNKHAAEIRAEINS